MRMLQSESATMERMPLYIYRCKRCDREIEELQKFEDPPPTPDDPCPYFEMIEDDPELCDLHSGHMHDPCNFERVPSSGHFDFPHASLDNVGRAGWKLTDQGVVYRHIQGK